MSHTCGNTGRRQELPCINCDCDSSARPEGSIARCEWIDAAADELERLRAENGRLRHALLTMLGETEDSDYMTGADQKRMALDALTHND